MKKYIILTIGIVFYGALFGQEIREINRIGADNRELETKTIAAELFPLYIDQKPETPFDLERFAVPLRLTEIPARAGKDNKLDILALSAAEERYRKSLIRNAQTSRQLDQIKSEIRTFTNSQQQDIWDRANNNLNYDKRTPDGGIRNEALEDIRQPFMNPFYNDYYYYPGYRPYGRSRNLYFYRR